MVINEKSLEKVKSNIKSDIFTYWKTLTRSLTEKSEMFNCEEDINKIIYDLNRIFLHTIEEIENCKFVIRIGGNENESDSSKEENHIG